MLKYCGLVLCCTLIFLCSLVIQVAAEELTFGTDLAGMGGAGVALTDDVYATYWNPAGLTRIKHFSIAPNLAGLVNTPKTVAQWDDYINNDGSRPEEGATALAGGMVGFATSRFAFNMLGQVRVDVAEEAQGLLLYNSKVSVAYPITLGGRQLSFGGTYNYYSGHLYQTTPEDLERILEAKTDSKQGFSLDLGVQAQLTSWLSLGFVGRDLYGHYEWGADHPLVLLQKPTPSYQGGIGLTGSGLRAAFDWEWDQQDLRRYRVGLAKDFWKIFTIRAGGILEPGQETTYTSGLSLRIGGFSMNTAAALQNETWSATVALAVNI